MFAIMGIAGNVGGAVSTLSSSIERRFGAYFGCLTTSPRQTVVPLRPGTLMHDLDI